MAHSLLDPQHCSVPFCEGIDNSFFKFLTSFLLPPSHFMRCLHTLPLYLMLCLLHKRPQDKKERMPFVLEMQEYLSEKNTFKHKGYISVIFTTRDEAADYLEKHKPDVPRLGVANRWKSVVIESDKTRYVAREYYGEKCELKPL